MKAPFILLTLGSVVFAVNTFLWKSTQSKFPELPFYDPQIVVRSDDPLISWEGEELYYNKEVFTGKIRLIGKDGRVYEESSIYKGVKHGKETRWNSMGMIISIEWYEKGEIWEKEKNK